MLSTGYSIYDVNRYLVFLIEIHRAVMDDETETSSRPQATTAETKALEKNTGLERSFGRSVELARAQSCRQRTRDDGMSRPSPGVKIGNNARGINHADSQREALASPFVDEEGGRKRERKGGSEA